MRYSVGIDVGSSATKAVLTNGQGVMLASAKVPTGLHLQRAAQAVYQQVLHEAGIEENELQRVVACGFGREKVDWAHDIRTEIRCHAKAAYQHAQRAVDVIDIGGQDTKVLQLDAQGRVRTFKLNRTCAAGTGAFLDEIARRLAVDEGASLPHLAAMSTERVELSSYCTVFAATEVLNLAKGDVALPDLAMAAYRAVVSRILEIGGLSGHPIVLTGGVIAHHPLLAELMRTQLECDVLLPPQPQLCGAYGACL